MGSRMLNETVAPLRRGGSDGTMTRTCRATGEALLALAGNRQRKVSPITGDTGKGAEGERVAEGRTVARKWGNARGSEGALLLIILQQQREARAE